MLRVEGVVKSFDGLSALRWRSLEVREGSITGLIGPNRAGETRDCDELAHDFHA